MDVKAYMAQVGQQARAASRIIGKANTGVKNQALTAIENRTLFFTLWLKALPDETAARLTPPADLVERVHA